MRYFFPTVLICGFFSLSFAQGSSVSGSERIVVIKSKGYRNSYFLDPATLKSLRVFSITELLSSLPVDLQSRSLKSGIQSDFSLRGSNFQGVLLLLDGQRLNDPQTAHHNSDLPFTKEDIETIQVMPGANSALFGPDAIGGAINILLKKPDERKRVLEFSAGSYETKSAIFSITEKNDNAGIRFSAEHQDSNGFRYDTDYRTFTSTLSFSSKVPDGEFNTNIGYNQKEFGAFDFYTPGLGYPSREWTRTYLLSSGFDLEKQGFIIRPHFLWRRHYDKFMLDKSGIRSRYVNHHRTDMYTPGIYFQKEAGFWGRLGFGLEYGREQINSTNLGKHNRAHQSVFVDNSGDLTSRFGEDFSLRLDNFDSFGLDFSAALNFRQKISESSACNLGLTRNTRIPVFTELYYDDPTTKGNPNLGPENSLGFEAGYTYKKEKLATKLTAFLRKEKAMIEWVKRGVSDLRWRAENISGADVFGLEGYLKFKINERLELTSNYTYLDKRIPDHGLIYKYGPNYVKHLANVLFTFKLPWADPSLCLTYKKKPNRRGWFLFGLSLSRNLSKNLQIFVKGNNLFNVEYQEIEGIPQPQRTIDAGLRFEW